ncbi:Acg family FMN-binding oxidoreductase [Paractinoplanes atraurantiacus]|uniref:Nitroreductase n=1 Tax=Paractinoplanes atraurantiacus TaxID=1036182 RepID=A0A285JJF8_9ACTN|nr:nitroreductase [Actinoplanes atraurantiacus]SNY59506.1 Nitroreductase [Actinoplanes atraurantiacus]
MTRPEKDVTRAEARTALEVAARESLRAPSVFNTQPWKWRLTGDTLELSSDPARRLGVTDAEGRLLLISCGGALHHARVSLAAAGWRAEVQRLPDDQRPDLLARVRVVGRTAADTQAEELVAVIPRRRTDRRAFGDRPVTQETLDRLRRLVEAQGAYLHVVPDDRVPELAIAVDEAADANYFDPAHHSELTKWTHRPAWADDGVPATTAVQPGLRRVPVRNFLPDGSPGMLPGADHDEGAAYVIIFGTTDKPVDLLRGGEAMSALLLRATAEGLATAPISEAVEVAWPRRLLSRLLSGVGEPYLIVRLGYVEAPGTVPPTPRRPPTDVIQIED